MRWPILLSLVLPLTTAAVAGECKPSGNVMANLYHYRAKIVAVYDGDTVTADIDLGFHVWLRGEKLRLIRINAPEVRGPERPQGLKSRDALRRHILGKKVIVETIKDRKGKYGRYLAEIWLGEENVNDWLVSQGLAEYHEY